MAVEVTNLNHGGLVTSPPYEREDSIGQYVVLMSTVYTSGWFLRFFVKVVNKIIFIQDSHEIG
jgi:hypothetical protein